MPGWQVTFDQHVSYCVINVIIGGAFANKTFIHIYSFDIKLKSCTISLDRLLSIKLIAAEIKKS